MIKKNVHKDPQLHGQIASGLKEASAYDEVVDEFARLYYMHSSPKDLQDLGSEHLTNLATHHLKQARNRNPDEISICGFNPTQKSTGWVSTYSVFQIVTADIPFLVSSVTALFKSCDIGILYLFHPILHVKRSVSKGMLRAISEVETSKRTQ